MPSGAAFCWAVLLNHAKEWEAPEKCKGGDAETGGRWDTTNSWKEIDSVQRRWELKRRPGSTVILIIWRAATVASTSLNMRHFVNTSYLMSETFTLFMTDVTETFSEETYWVLRWNELISMFYFQSVTDTVLLRSTCQYIVLNFFFLLLFFLHSLDSAALTVFELLTAPLLAIGLWMLDYMCPVILGFLGQTLISSPQGGPAGFLCGPDPRINNNNRIRQVRRITLRLCSYACGCVWKCTSLRVFDQPQSALP